MRERLLEQSESAEGCSEGNRTYTYRKRLEPRTNEKSSLSLANSERHTFSYSEYWK